MCRFRENYVILIAESRVIFTLIKSKAGSKENIQKLLDLQPENELKDDEIDNSDQLTKSSTTPDRM